jgi:predicted class III extradiol MEMO1 family dioxygenase
MMSFGNKNIYVEGGEIEFHETDRIAHLNEHGCWIIFLFLVVLMKTARWLRIFIKFQTN